MNTLLLWSRMVKLWDKFGLSSYFALSLLYLQWWYCHVDIVPHSWHLLETRHLLCTCTIACLHPAFIRGLAAFIRRRSLMEINTAHSTTPVCSVLADLPLSSSPVRTSVEIRLKRYSNSSTLVLLAPEEERFHVDMTYSQIYSLEVQLVHTVCLRCTVKGLKHQG